EARREAYAQKLKDPRWQKKRLEVMNRDNFTCRMCGDDKSHLNVHHLYYAESGNPWDVHESALLTLCETCHERETQEIRRARGVLYAAIFKSGFTSQQLLALAEEIDESPSGSLGDLLAAIA